MFSPPRRPTGPPRTSLRRPQRLPIRRPITTASKTRPIKKGLRPSDRVAMQGLHIRRSPPQTEPQNPRSQVRNPTGLQHHEARVVRNEMQPRLPLGRRSTQPPVAHPHLESPRLPAQQRHPTVVHPCNLASRPTKGPVKAKRVMRRHQPTPPAWLRHPPNRADGHIAERTSWQWQTIDHHHETRRTQRQFRCQ